jgi:glucose-1-phosphate cytidylyltransferase
MKAIILAGGLGTRISEETFDKPKPMVTLNKKPILWHLMNLLNRGGIDDFIIAAGYKSEVICEWVSQVEDKWNIEVLDSGLETQTGGRIKFCMDKYPGQRFLATYGDGLANVNVQKLVEFHEKQQCLATITAVRPPARFGVLETNNGLVTHFGEKQHTQGGWINGGFFILESSVRELVSGPSEPFETGAIPRLVAVDQLACFEHEGFWQPMDTLREKNDLDKLARQHNPPWLNF